MRSIATMTLAALTLTSACAGTLAPMDSAEHAYSEVHGDVSEACRARMEKAQIIWSDLTSVRIECRDDRAIACLAKFDSREAVIWVTEGQDDTTLAHEYLHVIFRCERPDDFDGNHNHRDSAWSKLPF